jgi:hypothetical protein
MNRKGTSNLFEQVVSIDNLRKAAERAMENADHRTLSMREYLSNKEGKLKELSDLLRTGNYKTGKYYKFTVKEPKERTISALPFYPDRIVHHACMAVLLPIWMKKFTADTYNCLKGRGTHGFVKALRATLDSDKEGTKYTLQIDIRHFYESINHEHLKSVLKWSIKDKRLLQLLYEIIDSESDGVPIGNYLSQFFATLDLTPFDHYVKEQIKAKHYFRYCDDMVFFAATKEELWRIFRTVKEYMESIGLTIKPNYRVFPTALGLDVVGYVFYPTHTRWRKRTKIRFEKKCSRARTKGKSGMAFKKSIGAYLGLMKYCNSYRLRRKWLGKEYELCCMKRFSEIAEGKDKIESYEGSSISINDLLNETVEIHSFRHINIHGKEKIIVQIRYANEWRYFFTGSTVIADKLDRYETQLPFEATLIKERNKHNNEYYTFR